MADVVVDEGAELELDVEFGRLLDEMAIESDAIVEEEAGLELDEELGKELEELAVESDASDVEFD